MHLVSNKENIDTSTQTGKLMLTMIGAINEFERTFPHSTKTLTKKFVRVFYIRFIQLYFYITLTVAIQPSNASASALQSASALFKYACISTE
ncbi:MAG: recombinase family protein [Oscillospiraceae bacterium]